MDSEMSSDFKLDLVERLFAIDTETKTPFTTQVITPGDAVDVMWSNQVNYGTSAEKKVFFFSSPKGNGRLGSGDVSSLHPHG